MEAYAKSLINDTYINAYIQHRYPDRLIDLAYANALAYQKIKSSERIFTSSTKLMAALLTKLNVGLIKNSPGTEEEKTVDLLFNDLMALKETFMASIAGEQIKMDELFDEKVKFIKVCLSPLVLFWKRLPFDILRALVAAAFTAKLKVPTRILKGCLGSR